MATLTDRSPPTLQRYKNYKNLYFKTLRAMKKLHYSNKFEENAKNSKKLGIQSMKCREDLKSQKVSTK